MTLPLTEQQERLWRFIRSRPRSPSFEEMSVELYGHQNGKGAVSSLLDRLEERRFIRRERGRKRSVVACDPAPTQLATVRTSELLAELERRGILLGCGV